MPIYEVGEIPGVGLPEAIAMLEKAAKKNKKVKPALGFLRRLQEVYKGPVTGVDFAFTAKGEIGVQVNFRVSRFEVGHAVFPEKMLPLFQELAAQGKTQN